MPNRIIKESICYSEDINKITPEEEVFFYRLLVNADDYGRIDARMSMLKAKLYPLKDMISDDINRYLMKLSDIKMITLYQNNDICYAQLNAWNKHQQIRAKRSKCPAMTDENSKLISFDINGNQVIAYAPVIQSNPIQSESNLESNPSSEIVYNYQKYLNDHNITRQKQVLDYMEKGLDSDVIIECIRDAITGEFPTKYVFGILDKCLAEKTTTFALYIERKKQFAKHQAQLRKEQKNKRPQDNFDQRQYEEVDLEKYYQNVEG